MIQVIKRNGDKVEFDKQRIVTAITKAYNDVNYTDTEPWYASIIANEVYAVAVEEESPLTVEDI